MARLDLKRVTFRMAAAVAAIIACTASASPAPDAAAPPARDIVLVPATGAPADYFVIWVSGDGGWGKMERNVTARLAAAGVPTVGISSLRYFAYQRRPEVAAAAVAALARTYGARWGDKRFVFAGFSFGADIGPLLVQDLPADVRAQVSLAAFLSPGARANYTAGPASWLGIGLGPRISPALFSLEPTKVLCIGSAGVFADICPDKPPQGMISVRLPGGHILNNQYDAISRLILDNAGVAPPGARR